MSKARCQAYHANTLHTVDGCEILHQLIDGKHPIIYRVSTCFNHPFGGAGFRNHRQYHKSSDQPHHGNMGSYEIATMIIGLWAWTYNGMNALWQYLSNNNRHILGYTKSTLCLLYIDYIMVHGLASHSANPMAIANISVIIIQLLSMALMNIYNIYKVVPEVIESLAKLVCHPRNGWVHGRYIELVMDMAVVNQLEKTPVTTFYSMSLIKDVGDPS
jgi:hypothetical protein